MTWEGLGKLGQRAKLVVIVARWAEFFFGNKGCKEYGS